MDDQRGIHKVRMATASLAGCFGCHMSLLDIDERLFDLIERVEFDRSPITDIKNCGKCDIGLIEGVCVMSKIWKFFSSFAKTVKC